MTTPFLSYAFPATGRSGITGSRTVPDRLQSPINVKDDFGAKGDGSTDDTAAIQAAFNAAFTQGSPDVPNGSSLYKNNRPVFLPAGIYNVSNHLRLKWVYSSTVFGAGSAATKIRYVGPLGTDVNPAGGTFTNIISTNGVNHCVFKNFGLEFATQVKASGTRCFQLTWQGGGATNDAGTSGNQLINIACSGAEAGIAVGEFIIVEDPGPIQGVTSQQSDTTEFWNPIIDNCVNGIMHVGQNAISNGVFGGRITNCSTAIYTPAGCVQFIAGVYFEGNGVDWTNDTGDPTILVGCTSKSPNFAQPSAGHNLLLANRHVANSAGTFCKIDINSEVTLLSNYSRNGYLQGANDNDPHSGRFSEFHLINNEFDNPDWSHISGNIHVLVNPRRLYIANPGSPDLAKDLIPPSNWWADGLVFENIADSTTNTQFASSSGGGGSNHVMMRWNGSALRVIGK